MQLAVNVPGWIWGLRAIGVLVGDPELEATRAGLSGEALQAFSQVLPAEVLRRLREHSARPAQPMQRVSLRRGAKVHPGLAALLAYYARLTEPEHMR